MESEFFYDFNIVDRPTIKSCSFQIQISNNAPGGKKEGLGAAPVMFDTSPEYVSSNDSPTSFMTTSPPSTKSNILHSRSFILFRGHAFLHWLNLRPFSNMSVSRGSKLNLLDIWSLKRGDSIQISALSPPFEVAQIDLHPMHNWWIRPMH